MRSDRLRRRYLPAIGLLLLAGLAIAAADPPAADRPAVDRPNVVVISVNMLRADRMPCDGYDRNTTPFLCRYAADNVEFEEAVAPAGWTHPSIASLFTGQYPAVHGVRENDSSLDRSSPTLAEVLSRNGYRTVSFAGWRENAPAGAGQSHLLPPQYGLDRGFDEYHGLSPYLEENGEAAAGWLREERAGPFFLFVQGFEPQRYKYPDTYLSADRAIDGTGIVDAGYDGLLTDRDYLSRITSLSGSIVETDDGYRAVVDGEVRNATPADLEHVQQTYDALLRLADRRVKRVVTALREEGLANETVVVVTSSHGVYLDDPTEYRITVRPGQERVFGHAMVSEPEIRVPLIVHLPGRDGGSVDAQVELVDVMPTVLDAAGRDIPGRVQGESLLPYVEGARTEGEPAVVTGGWKLHAVRTDRWKYIRHPAAGGTRLYDLEAGVEEGDVLHERPAVAQQLQGVLDRWAIENRQLESRLSSGP